MGSFAPPFFHNDVAAWRISLNVNILHNVPKIPVFRVKISLIENFTNFEPFSDVVF